MNKNQKLIVALVVACVLITSMSVTYAYFTVTRNTEGEPSDQIVTTGTLDLNFTDGPQVSIDRAFPGDNVQKEFRVSNTGTLDTDYQIGWQYLNNQITNDELVLSYTCTSYVNYGTGTQAVSGTCDGKTATVVGNNQAAPITANIAIAAGITHVYNLNVTFIETSSVQNYNQGRSFDGVLNITESTPAPVGE